MESNEYFTKLEQEGYVESADLDKEQSEQSLGRNVGAINANVNAAAQQTHMDKFHAAQGHGYAAEQANNLYDVLTGKNASIVGGDNAKNGADRLVNGVTIQTKYCRTATDSVAAAFDNGQYRYFNPDGTPMQLEVPSDQYDKAVELMAEKIKKGQIPGVKDPADAKELVRKGHFTYKQACNIAKFGTIDSIVFDAVNGAITSLSAFGISVMLTFAQALWRGDSLSLAAEKAICAGVDSGKVAFLNTVITSQAMRTPITEALKAPADYTAQLFSKGTQKKLTKALLGGANISGKAAMNNLSKLLRGNFITSAVMIPILSARDIGEAFRGRISGKQLFKNLLNTTGEVFSGTAGLIVANLLLPASGVAAVAVSIVGNVIGGAAGGTITKKAVGYFIEDDAVELTKIIESTFCDLTQEYMLSEEETGIVLEDLSRIITGETLLQMFASDDRQAYADRLVRDRIERLIRRRCRILVLDQVAFARGMERIIRDADAGTGLFAPEGQQAPDPVEIAERVTGKSFESYAARVGVYTAKQMNLAQKQAEFCMESIKEDIMQSESRDTARAEEVEKINKSLSEELKRIQHIKDEP